MINYKNFIASTVIQEPKRRNDKQLILTEYSKYPQYFLNHLLVNT